MELIDRRKLVSDFWKGVEDCAILSYEDTDELMENAPTVDAVEVVHGRWLKTNVEAGDPFDGNSVYCFDVFACSECGCHFDVSEAMNYCPNCGAKMDGGKDNATDQP